MTNRRLVTGAVFAALTLGLTACSDTPGEDGAGTPPVESTASPVVEERQANFKAMGKAFKAIRIQLEGESPDIAAIATAATDLNAAALKVDGYFPEGTSVDDGYDTEALATIWETPEDFAAAHQRLLDASAQMVTVVEGGDVAAIGGQVRALGGACQNCHDSFRLETD